ncbi:MAG: hypothetical protein R6V41_10880 [Desulfobacteraceae bacterium]
MLQIIVSDIFGKTPALEEIARALPGETEIFDPYNEVFMDFKDESRAYEYFTNEVGLEDYAGDLAGRIQSERKNVTLIGFSVGASAVWLVSPEKTACRIPSGICFYGSQIRKYTGITPGFPVKMVLPKFEKHFSVQKLAEKIGRKSNVTIYPSEYFHGFMNSYSENFNRKAYDFYMQWLCKEIRALIK